MNIFKMCEYTKFLIYKNSELFYSRAITLHVGDGASCQHRANEQKKAERAGWAMAC